jgi:hypothetical protein
MDAWVVDVSVYMVACMAGLAWSISELEGLKG